MKKLIILLITFCFAFGIEAQVTKVGCNCPQYNMPDFDGNGKYGPFETDKEINYNQYITPGWEFIRFNVSYYVCDSIKRINKVYYRFGEGGNIIKGAKYTHPAPAYVFFDGLAVNNAKDTCYFELK